MKYVVAALVVNKVKPGDLFNDAQYKENNEKIYVYQVVMMSI